MELADLSGRIIDELYSGLTGGSAELPLPENMIINWIQPGIPFHPSAFDFAIAGPYAGPTTLTLDDFRELVDILLQEGGEGADRNQAVEDAKALYQQNLLGGWEGWSRLVDFIPIVNPSPADSQWKANDKQGEQKHTQVVYGQAGQTLSGIYADTLVRCEVAAEEPTEEELAILERMRALLQEEVEVPDFLGGPPRIEIRESRAMTMYKEKRVLYENAVIDYASRLARANSGSAADLVEWSRSGGLYRARADRALRDWVARGYKEDIERAQATIEHITGGSMVQWKGDLQAKINDIENNVNGVFGYPFFPATVLPGGFARSEGWTEYKQMELHRKVTSTSSSKRGSGTVGFSLGLFSIGGGGGGGTTEHTFDFQENRFGIEFEYTQCEIARPAFNPNFFLSRGWRPRDEFVRDHGTLHSDGEENPKGAMIGYPTKALFIRDLTIHNSDFAKFMRTKQDDISGGGVVGFGPFCLGGKYSQSNKRTESNLDVKTNSITVKGLQLVAFVSALFPYTANPSPDVQKWI